MTFSILARCAQTGMFGVAVTSPDLAVAGRCAHAREGAGAVVTLTFTDPTLGHRGLDLLQGGLSADQALTRLRETGRDIEFRQLALVDQQGGVAAFSGRRVRGRHASKLGDGVVAVGSMLASEDVPSRMVEAFAAGEASDLGDRLLAALAAGLAAGGTEMPVRSAGLLIVRDVAWPVADLRINWTEGNPVAELASLWTLWKPRMEEDVTLALDPASATASGYDI